MSMHWPAIALAAAIGIRMTGSLAFGDVAPTKYARSNTTLAPRADGNYRVTVTVKADGAPADVWVKAETRRLMAEKVHVDAGQSKQIVFTVNVRSDVISDGRRVKLKDREREPRVRHWDDKLDVEVFHTSTSGGTVSIDVRDERVDDAITIFLAGDSTVTDQPGAPWNSWGQMLPRFFDEKVAVANYAESGESFSSFVGARRWEKLLTQMKKGDYLFVQFGHNDQKQGTPDAIDFAGKLRTFIKETKDRGATPVLVTSMHRRRFDKEGKVVDTMAGFPAVVREVAKAEGVPLIDLNEMSAKLYEALGPDGSKAAFQDGTHHNNYGSYELAKCVVVGVRTGVTELAKHLSADVPAEFDPSKPDDANTWSIPDTDAGPTTKPDGN